MGMLAKSIFCHARYSPILTASALRWKKDAAGCRALNR